MVSGYEAALTIHAKVLVGEQMVLDDPLEEVDQSRTDLEGNMVGMS